MRKFFAFTLAEVLITLAVIGVVAAVTMPVLMNNINERVNSERQVNIVYKFNQAMEHMRAMGKLTAYDSTESFVNELQKHMKIVKVCDNEHLAECWPTEKVIMASEEEFNIADAKTGENLSLTTNTNNVGLILADGASVILNWNNAFAGMDISAKVTPSPIELPTSGHGSKVYLQYTTNLMAPVKFIMDVNGKKGPNAEKSGDKYNDIRSFGGARLAKSETPFVCPGDEINGTCVYFAGKAYSAFNCSSGNSGADGFSEYCGSHPSGYSEDYWAGGKAECASHSMNVPTTSQLTTIINNRSTYPSIASNADWFWSSEEYGDNPETRAKHIPFGGDGNGSKSSQLYVICVKE